jgi:DNA polymerase III delta prime subunit
VTNNLTVTIPQSVVWLLRLASDRTLSRALQNNPMAFAAWYAAMGSAINWPEPVLQIQKSERARRLSIDRIMKLLSHANYALSGRTNAAHARILLEGYAVHEWVQRHPEDFIALAASQQENFDSAERLSDSLIETLSPFASRVLELGRVLKLSTLEKDILSFAFLTSVSDELAGIFEQLASDRWTARVLWSVLFSTTVDELTKAMRPRSTLRLSGLLQTSGGRVQLARVSTFWVELLAGTESLGDALLEPLDDKIGSGRPARLLEEDLAIAQRLLRNGAEPGVNLLLFGDAGLEKKRLLSQIISGSGRTAWRMRRFDDAPRDVLPSLTYVALQVLAAKSLTAVLVIERPSEVLHTAPSEFLQALFGVDFSNDDNLPFDENLLSTNPIPAVWLTSDVARLPDDTVARFVFHAPLKKADRKEQEAVVRERLRKLRLGKEAVTQIMAMNGVSSAQLETAVKTARLVRVTNRAERDKAVVQALRRSQRALSRDLTDTFKPSVTSYSLQYLNTAGRFTPEQILKSLRRRPKGTVLLYGPPGTGKTQFTEYLANQLGLPLVSKSASALLSKWLGESEKNIASAFEEAAAEDAILFFDEGDSFLRSRERAHNSWEVTQTNELLQKMERFDGIVIVATNLFRDLDAAALRRFTFKIEFCELDQMQRWRMFVAEAGLTDREALLDAATREAWENRLLLMRHLTPGDFATVKRQCLVLDTLLSPEQWLEQLEIECQIKNGAPRLETVEWRAA